LGEIDRERAHVAVLRAALEGILRPIADDEGTWCQVCGRAVDACVGDCRAGRAALAATPQSSAALWRAMEAVVAQVLLDAAPGHCRWCERAAVAGAYHGEQIQHRGWCPRPAAEAVEAARKEVDR